MPARATLLVVDDDAAVLEKLREELAAEYRLRLASSASVALDIVEREEIDLLISDQKMPGMTGLELIAKAQALCPNLTAILLTGYTDPKDLILAINAGHVYRYVPKPWDPADLASTVRHALEAHALRQERDSLVEKLQKRLDALSILYEVATGAGNVDSFSGIINLITGALHRIVRFDVAASLISVAEPKGAVMHLHCQTPCDDQTMTLARDRCVELFGSLTGQAYSEDQLVVNVTGERLLDAPAPPRAQSYTHIPLVVDGRVVGVIYLCVFRTRAFTTDDEKLLYLLANQTSEAIRRLSTRILDERRKMGLMVESMADGVIMTDETSEVILINPAARRMLGIARDVVVTTKYLKERLGFYPFDLVARQAPQLLREELKVGDKTLHSIVSPVLDGSDQLVGVVVVLRDITEWKELDRRKEEFVSIVSHELRTPLTSIAGALDIVLKEYAGGVPGKQRRYLEMARESCAKLNVIVDDLLDVARFERGKMPMQFRPLSLDELAIECVDRFRAAGEAKQVGIHLHVAKPDVRIIGDAGRLSQVLSNLLSNAIKFTPEGGRVEVEVFGPGVAAAHVGVSVWNNGEPIPEDDRERVFDKFEQVQASSTRRVGGTGLGLAISRSIITGHGGNIWVEQAPQGTKFVFTLPAAPEMSDDEEQDSELSLGGKSPSSAETATSRQVLVVDDDRSATYILKGVLLKAGHRVHVAHDADEALTIARERKPDLISVDVLMAGVDGLALVEILKHDPDTRKAAVVVVSAAEKQAQAIAAGADAYLDKPVDVDQYQATCTRLLSERGRAQAVKVLLVDDDPGIRMICREVLENEGFVVREAPDGETALAEAKRFRPDLMLLDVMMPDLDGFQTAKKFRAERSFAMTPVIFVSARGQTADKVRAFKLGADDYLVKPFDAAELVARVEKALERRERELGASPTTRLPGAGAIESEIERRLQGRGDFAFCYLDLDNLKAFNDYYGYAKADGVIRQMGDLVREVVAREGSPGDFIGHIAGDDFVFITTADRVDRVCTTICQTFDRLVPLYYNKLDRERGHIETQDRYGDLRKFPIMSVSIAALTSRRHGEAGLSSHTALATAAAEAKKRAKAILGTAYVRDGEILLPLSPPHVTAA
jgi:PAS domain S-box-containing protein